MGREIRRARVAHRAARSIPRFSALQTFPLPSSLPLALRFAYDQSYGAKSYISGNAAGRDFKRRCVRRYAGTPTSNFRVYPASPGRHACMFQQPRIKRDPRRGNKIENISRASSEAFRKRSGKFGRPYFEGRLFSGFRRDNETFVVIGPGGAVAFSDSL